MMVWLGYAESSIDRYYLTKNIYQKKQRKRDIQRSSGLWHHNINSLQITTAEGSSIIA